MSESQETLEKFANKEYKWGFVTDVESDSLPPGLDEEKIAELSKKKAEPQFMLDWLSLIHI